MLWGKWIPHFTKNSLIMEEVEVICSTWLILKMTPVQMVLAFILIIDHILSLTIILIDFAFASVVFLLSMGLFCMGSHLCIIFGGTVGMFSCVEVWHWGRSSCKKFSSFLVFTVIVISSHHTHYACFLNKESLTIMNFFTEDQRFGYCRIARALASFTTTSLPSC